MVLFNIAALHWDNNEKTGFRQISVTYEGKQIISIISNKTLGIWGSRIVPLGFSYNKDEVQMLSTLYKNIECIMNFLEQDIVLNQDAVLDFLENINV
ncbi:hypothetical protein DIDNDMLP_00360 [Klebsiella phage KP13-7]|nr:hypothetical protein DIDNDMLP_00360 [Klebsiella phage KP13-7]